MKYSPRLKAPSTTDKNFLHHTKGGYNYCIQIEAGSCIPNCVGYAWGRWREILGKKHKLSTANAENWWGNTKDGYERGQTPKLGAVMCWAKGKAGVSSDGAGHVAVVEQIHEDGSVTYSNSNYSGTRFYMKTLKPPFKLGAAYTFQGFIYLPISFDDETKKETEKKTEYFKKYTGKSSSIVDALVSLKVEHSFSYRKKIAAANGIKNYKGSAADNIKMLKLLKTGKLIKS